MDNNFDDNIMEFSKEWIQKAESIKTSGRWSSINKEILRFASEPHYRRTHFEGLENDWMFEVFSSLCSQIFEEYLNLKEAHEKKNLATSEVTWRTRNLLELFIWVGYCSKSTDNARRFYDDAGRDMHDLADSFIKWGSNTGQDDEFIQNFVSTKDDLKFNAELRGVQNIDAKYTDVRNAAKDIGLGKHFSISNKLLSKYTHPTAALILGSSEFRESLRAYFFAEGCMYFCGAFDILEIWIMGTKEEQRKRLAY